MSTEHDAAHYSAAWRLLAPLGTPCIPHDICIHGNSQRPYSAFHLHVHIEIPFALSVRTTWQKSFCIEHGVEEYRWLKR